MSFTTGASRVCCVGILCLLASNASATEVWFEEHGDIGIAYESGELELHYHFEDGLNGVGPLDVEFEPDEVTVLVGGTSVRTADAGDAFFGYLGMSLGDTYYRLPQVNGGPEGADALGLPFVGIATEELDVAGFTTMNLSLTGLTAPGDFALWQGGASALLDSSDGIDGSDSFSLALNGHDHFNFGFSELGVYEVEFTASGNLTGTGTVTDTAVFTFNVVPEPGSLAALVSLGMVGVLRRHRRRS